MCGSDPSLVPGPVAVQLAGWQNVDQETARGRKKGNSLEKTKNWMVELNPATWDDEAGEKTPADEMVSLRLAPGGRERYR